MNEAIAERWVEALRSGEYKQGMGALKVGETYCCLGVLCELHSQETGDVFESEEGSSFEVYLDKSNVLPAQVVDWAQMRSPSGTRPGGFSGCEDLVTVNDSGKSFDYIANLIEKHWREL